MNDELEVVEPELYDMGSVTPTEHRHDYIVGNELRCTLHDGKCPTIHVKPTMVLERNAEGVLELVDKG